LPLPQSSSKASFAPLGNGGNFESCAVTAIGMTARKEIERVRFIQFMALAFLLDRKRATITRHPIVQTTAPRTASPGCLNQPVTNVALATPACHASPEILMHAS
jgi:hypothetical protein